MFSLLLLMTLPVYVDPVSGRLFHPSYAAVCLSEFFPITLIHFRVSLPGDQMPGVPPVPIPNTAVKPRAANGSRTFGPARVGRCQVMARMLRKQHPGLLAFCPPTFIPLRPRWLLSSEVIPGAYPIPPPLSSRQSCTLTQHRQSLGKDQRRPTGLYPQRTTLPQ